VSKRLKRGHRALLALNKEIFAQANRNRVEGEAGGHVVTGLNHAAAKRLNDFDVWTRSTEFEIHVI
jgi:hypothetical protein